jgi:hypothetical protein
MKLFFQKMIKLLKGSGTKGIREADKNVELHNYSWE